MAAAPAPQGQSGYERDGHGIGATQGDRPWSGPSCAFALRRHGRGGLAIAFGCRIADTHLQGRGSTPSVPGTAQNEESRHGAAPGGDRRRATRMECLVPQDDMTRRALLLRGAATASAIVAAPLVLSNVAHADTTVGTFALDPTQGGTCSTGSCVSCQACISHAANKLFRTATAADQGRAHPGCLCTVIAGQAFSQATLTNVFAQGDMADRRYGQTTQYLNGEVEQRSVPMATGVVPVAVMVGGAAAIWVIAARRRHELPDPLA